MRKQLLGTVAAILASSGMSGVAVSGDTIQVKSSAVQSTVKGVVEKAKSERVSKAARLGNGYYRRFKFPRSRKTVTAAQLKRSAKKRNNIKARSAK